eukprot:CAMPEP_0118890074 /NCGR_PEP_ID=MMETSP1166-20130328/711_1 /TAXON_ID=1104430 /ORGANISM="Chrysoreinhardia sp, Strain CCMP3193" /LENGTH=611 /DNA_ID=CAMNT_0006828675 /DNA_START=101 /DNA_END=1936 /DNA_ORIENTATION=-
MAEGVPRLKRPYEGEGWSDAFAQQMGCKERRGSASRVIHGSEAVALRLKVLEKMAHENLVGSKQRRGQYWKRKLIEEAFSDYAKEAREAFESEGVLKEGLWLGLLDKPKDLLDEDLFPELHRVDGDGPLHRTVRRWHLAAAKAKKKKNFWLKCLRAYLLAGAALSTSLWETTIELDACDPLRTLLEFTSSSSSASGGATPTAKEIPPKPHLVAAEANAPKCFAVLVGFLAETSSLDASERTDGGQTVLHVAVVNDSVDILEVALSYPEFRRQLNARTTHLTTRPGVTTDTTIETSIHNLNQTALAKATRYGHYRSLATLLNAGAKPDLVDAFGRTPLHVAAEYGFYQCMKLLLEHGADPKKTDARGRAPRDHVDLGQANNGTLAAAAGSTHKKTTSVFSSVFPSSSSSSAPPGGGENTSLAVVKAVVDYDKCHKLLACMDTIGLPRGSSYFGFLLNYFAPQDCVVNLQKTKNTSASGRPPAVDADLTEEQKFDDSKSKQQRRPSKTFADVILDLLFCREALAPSPADDDDPSSSPTEPAAAPANDRLPRHRRKASSAPPQHHHPRPRKHRSPVQRKSKSPPPNKAAAAPASEKNSATKQTEAWTRAPLATK